MSTSVDNLTAQMATTSLENTNEPAATQPTAAENEAVLASAAEGRRLYIGNLAYATTEGELKDFFKDYLVESVTIPTNPRTSRPVGYAFVALSTPSEAERAIAELNGKAILERKVSIQLARTPEAHAEGNGSGAEGASGGEHRRRASTRGRGRGRGRGGRGAGRGGRGGKADGADGAEQVELVDAAPAESTPTNVPGQVVGLTETTNESLTADKADKKTGPRERKQRGPPEDGVPSKTKVMVANLPYDLKEGRLLEIFKDYSPVNAKIALRPIPRFMVKKLQARGEPRKGRGFGFVTLGSEELQQKACNEMNGKEIEGREIAVKVAIDSPGKEDDHMEAPAEGEAAATATAGDAAAAPAESTETPAGAVPEPTAA
ncbi:RNA-binding domain-containing protein [Bimuria novae-zelandiae CBS 107.79]|uniref:RNA-binding domain-containing protein n=1 Tax=Bimuria novae-zelandiae CBS 107.79 TaxID=1447943 RepID=A0A6A5VCR8_9PLEO|nr:RNA-binding domain-containing protein [Bimuria novae-zelandiae CBS 107.79]